MSAAESAAREQTSKVDVRLAVVWREQRKPRRRSPREFRCALACGLDLVVREVKPKKFVLLVEGIICMPLLASNEWEAKRAAIPTLFGALTRLTGEVGDIMRAQLEERRSWFARGETTDGD